jgi:NAD(P)H dehydrogenase (quinone)
LYLTNIKNMSKILITGASGAVGKKTIEHLLKKGIPASQLVGLSRKTEGLEDLISKGVEIRIGDYFDYNSLLHAFEGVSKVMLTSAVAFTDRSTQHFNVITAARQVGVKHVVYMSVMRKQGSERIMNGITESDLFTEQALKSSGLDYTIVYHPPFLDLLSFYYGATPFENGINIPASDGKMAPATRNELAEAHAEILNTAGHENKIYSLGGSYAFSFVDIAKYLGEIKQHAISFKTISTEQYIDGMVAQGMPQPVAEFLTNWVIAIEAGEFAYQSGDLERLLGRKTISFKEHIESTLL